MSTGFPFSAMWPSHQMMPEQIIRQILAEQSATVAQVELLNQRGYLATVPPGSVPTGIPQDLAVTFTCMYFLYDKMFAARPHRTGRLYFDAEFRLVAIEEQTPERAMHIAREPGGHLLIYESSEAYLAG